MLNIQNFFDPATLDLFIKLILALFLGTLISVERIWAHKTAGMRTYAMVSMGAALFVLISESLFQKYVGITSFNPVHMAAQIITGIGFLGAGLIIFQPTESKIVGLTTASGLWVSAGIGTAVGFGLFKLAIIGTILALVIFVALWFVEQGVKNLRDKKQG